MEELALNFDGLWSAHTSSGTTQFQSTSGTPVSSVDYSLLDEFLNVSSPSTVPPAKPRKWQIQPPAIHFNVREPISISVTLFNGSFPSGYFYSPKDPATVPDAGPAAPVAFRYTPPPSEDEVPPDLLPPWNPFSLYKSPVGKKSPLGPKRYIDNRHLWEKQADGHYKEFFGGTFSTTSFDVFAQSLRRRVLLSVGREITALPGGKTKDLISGEEQECLSWFTKDDPKDKGKQKTSEKRAYANYECPFGTGDNEAMEMEEMEAQGWWMVGPRRLPTGFAGEEGKRTFVVKNVEEAVDLLRRFMERCGLGGEIIKVLIPCCKLRFRLLMLIIKGLYILLDSASAPKSTF
jgi:hypothetical protein